MIDHGGNVGKLARETGFSKSEILDFSVNLHPDGPPEGLFPVCFRALDGIAPYPEPHAERLSGIAAKKWNLLPENILFGNGSGELLSLIPRAVGRKRAVVVSPGYLEYENSCVNAGMRVERFPLSERDDFIPSLDALGKVLPDGALAILGNPGNPTGTAVPARTLHAFIRTRPDVFFLIDEAFADFTGDTLLRYELLPNAVILRSMTKYWAVAGLRLGWCAAVPETIAEIRELQPPWSVGTVAAKAAKFLLEQPERTDISELRESLVRDLTDLNIKVFPSSANYLLLKTERPLAAFLLRDKIAVRDCSNYPGLSDCFLRVAVRSAGDNRTLAAALRNILRPGFPALLRKKNKPALMLQGTASNAGKSILTAAFCRILLQDGYSAAPFKAQNMALNSYVTPDGGEIGRAQAVQAEACRIDPDVRMNPILLKPNSDLGSQVVVLGKPIGNFKVRDYFARKRELWNTVCQAYDSLAAEHDCMVLEGAGSPGEINLKRFDVVNMRMARYAQSPVLLAGDIDRGGVYASFIGTYATLEAWERELLYGFVVNKFRGDPGLLADAHLQVEKMTGKPVLGIIDYQHDLGLPEEDSVNFGFTERCVKNADALDLAVVHLGHIANFTDFAPFEGEPDAKIRIVHNGDELGNPDLILLPGSKSVADDLARLRGNGLFEKIRSSGAFLTGICGGLQILGEKLLDPEAVESREPDVDCMGILPLVTVMRKRKTLRRTTARRYDSPPLAGYEIHHGETVCSNPEVRTMISDDGRPVGFETGRVFATYLHGVFDDDRFRRDFLNGLRRRKGLAPLNPSSRYGIEEALNRLADHVRSRINISELYRKMGLKG